MKFSETSKFYSLNKSTYVNLRWIAYIGQLSAILFVEFFLNFSFNYFACILIIFFSVLTNFYLQFYIKEKDQTWWRVRIGHFTEKTKAELTKKELSKIKGNDLWIDFIKE